MEEQLVHRCFQQHLITKLFYRPPPNTYWFKLKLACKILRDEVKSASIVGQRGVSLHLPIAHQDHGGQDALEVVPLGQWTESSGL